MSNINDNNGDTLRATHVRKETEEQLDYSHSVLTSPKAALTWCWLLNQIIRPPSRLFPTLTGRCRVYRMFAFQLLTLKLEIAICRGGGPYRLMKQTFFCVAWEMS